MLMRVIQNMAEIVINMGTSIKENVMVPAILHALTWDLTRVHVVRIQQGTP
jgi:hypothetical protein